MTEQIETPTETLSTREIMEQNWDRFMTDSSQEGVEKKAPFDPVAENVEEMEKISPENKEEEFNPLPLIDANYELIQNLLDKEDKTSKEKWLQNLFELEKMYHQEPLKAVKLILNDYLKKKGIAPLKETMPQNLAELAQMPQGTPLYTAQMPQGTPIYPAQMPQNAYQNMVLSQPHQLPQGIPLYKAQMPQGTPLYKAQMPQGVPQPQPNQPSFYPRAIPVPQNFYPPWAENAPTTNQRPADDFSKLDIQSLIKQGVEDYFKTKTEESQKAKTASFTPKGTAKNMPKSQTHTASGRLKTTREILEEGCKMFGI